jgi:hypothetical protein
MLEKPIARGYEADLPAPERFRRNAEAAHFLFT